MTFALFDEGAGASRTGEPVPKKPQSPGVASYYQALQEVFRLQSLVLSQVLPHHGERGGNNEAALRQFLARVLPKKFSIGTGFMISSRPGSEPSSQTDIVIYDEVQNSPLHRELAAFVYPIEMVYGAVEVKGVLRRKDLKHIAENINRIRSLAKDRVYVKYGSAAFDPARPEAQVVKINEFASEWPPPRAFVFAYSQKGWASAESLRESLIRVLGRTPSHIHGLIVLDQDWYLAQVPYTKPPCFEIREAEALLQFVSGMMHSLASLPMFTCSVDRYMRQATQSGRTQGRG